MLTNTDGHVWVHNKQAWKPVGNLGKDDFRFAQCDLFGANTIIPIIITNKANSPSTAAFFAISVFLLLVVYIFFEY